MDESFFTGNPDALCSSHDSVMAQVDTSLNRLGTDYIDLYYQHRIDPKTEPEEVAETMAELIKNGKIRAWGVSFAPEDYIRRAHKVCPISAIENMYSFVARQDEKTKVLLVTAMSSFISAAMSKVPMNMFLNCLARKLSTRTPMGVHEGETATTQQTISSQGVSS